MAERITRLVLQFLDESGYSRAKQALEQESGLVIPAAGSSGSAGELCMIVDDHDSLARLTQGQAQMGSGHDEERQLLSRGGDGSFFCREVGRFDGLHGCNILCTASSDGPGFSWAATGAVDRTITVVDRSCGSIIWKSSPRQGSVLCLDFHPIDRTVLLSGDMNGNAVITHVAGPSSDAPGTGASTAQEVHPIATFSDHTKYVVRTRWSPDGQRFATASYDKSICLYGHDLSAPTDQAACTHPNAVPGSWTLQRRWEFPGTVECIVFCSNTLLIASVRDSHFLYYIDCVSEDVTEINMNPNLDDWVSFVAMDLAVSPDGNFLLVATGVTDTCCHSTHDVILPMDQSKMLLYKIGGSDQLRRFYGGDNDIYSNPRCCWHPNGLYVYCTAQDNNVHVWEVASQKRVGHLSGHEKCVRGLVPSPSGLMTCSYDQTVRVWSA